MNGKLLARSLQFGDSVNFYFLAELSLSIIFFIFFILFLFLREFSFPLTTNLFIFKRR